MLVRCTEGDDIEVHAAAETPAGTYSASHTFDAAGDVTAEVEFPGLEGAAVVTVPLVVTP